MGVQELNEEEGGGDQPLPGTLRSTVPQTSQQSFLQSPVPAQPVAQPTTTLASATPPAPSGPVDRSRFAALFPNDMASGMIRQQGIGSLMG